MWNFAYTQKKIISASIKTLQIRFFTFVSSKVVYFKKHLVSIAPLGKDVFTAIKCSYGRQTVKLAAEAMTEPLQT